MLENNNNNLNKSNMKKLIIILAIVISATTIIAQEQFTQMIDSIFQFVNKDDAKTGILYEHNREHEIKVQAPYKHSVGGMVHIFAVGPSYKTFFAKNFAFQTDVFFKLLFTRTTDDVMWEPCAVYGSFQINSNFIYQKKMKTCSVYDLFFLIGGGGSLGITPIQGNGKVGANAILGVEIVFNFPLAIQFDIRPGYGTMFNHSGRLIDSGWNPYPCYSPWHHFDWSFGITLRKVYKKNIS